MASAVARCIGKGLNLAQKLVTWEQQWLKEEGIEEGRRGCFAKLRSWFNGEGFQLAARGWISGAGDKLTTYGLAKAIGEYLDSQRATEAVEACFGPGGNRIRARTALRWLKTLDYIMASSQRYRYRTNRCGQVTERRHSFPNGKTFSDG